MSRIAKSPVAIPAGIQVSLEGQQLTIKGAKETLSWGVHEKVEIKQEENELLFSGRNDEKQAWALAGTTRALVNNMVIGVTTGFEKKLELVGVGYRVKAEGNTLNLSLGFSHPVNYPVPAGVSVETPTQTEIVLKGADKQQLGQIAAEIRAFRPPEPYKGKGVRYAGENVRRKEAKKK
ncbi:50S ribosomal protein L6 [Oceanicoccus sp. KOV_DT_Chl]|uniref:50S ribosomal protein L6 n=1 Tax=Oceanicoccus sp. KOV_DT_Chl TaxID=1904639 RepID=UPI000C7DD903|nr:50S ribosomal protein L6 [Oceanicoccus sp. KOV_DT_Chl]